MKFIYLLFLFIGLCTGKPGVTEDKVKTKCCIDHPDKPITPLNIANYDCSQLLIHGKNRCNEVWGGGTCIWKNGKVCKNQNIGCKRLPYYETHNQQSIDVGLCKGNCKDQTKCKPSEYEYKELSDTEGQQIRIIKKCNCGECSAIPHSKLVEIPVGKCEGECNEQKSKICQTGIIDNFSNSNGLEVSNPSTLLLTGILSTCSAGVQNGFDHFIDNRCFGHTFTNCFQQGNCPLRHASLRICMRAAQVSLTNTDSLILGVNGAAVWSKGLPSLNFGSWNPDDTLCLDLDLGNLPIDGANILNIIGSVGHLDVVVQDDSAVDYLTLKIQYEDCEKCLPTSTTINTLYHDNGITNYINIKDCDCINMTECHRAEYFEVHYPGTIFETIVDKGQCVGKCSKFLRCAPNKVIYSKIKAPEGSKEISKIDSCACTKIPWNGLAIKA